MAEEEKQIGPVKEYYDNLASFEDRSGYSNQYQSTTLLDNDSADDGSEISTNIRDAVSARDVFDKMLFGASNNKANARSIITLQNLLMVTGMPPIADNVVDPPPFLGGSSNDILNGDLGIRRNPNLAFGTGLVGMDYTERNIIGGSFLILIPLEIRPSIIDNLKNKVMEKTGLNKLSSRFGIADYGLSPSIATQRYNISYKTLTKAAMINLGLVKNQGIYTTERLRRLLPDYLLQNVLELQKADNNSFIRSTTEGILRSSANDIVNSILSGSQVSNTLTRSGVLNTANITNAIKSKLEQSEIFKEGTRLLGDVRNVLTDGLNTVRGAISTVGDTLHEVTNNVINTVEDTVGIDLINNDYLNDVINGTVQNINNTVNSAINGVVSDVASTTGIGNESNAENIISGTSFLNLMKYATNLDDSEVADMGNMPIIPFFIDGPVERTFSNSISTNESEVAKNFAGGFWNKMVSESVNKGMNMLTNGLQGGVDVEAIANEQSYHHSGFFSENSSSWVLSNMYIPKVIQQTQADFSYSMKITVKSASDPVSLLRTVDLFNRICPFITPVSSGKNNIIIPNAPLYCSAFVKGIMSISRAAVTSANIIVNPQTVTSEGVPTEMSVQLTITPLFSISAMPDYGKWWNGGEDESAIMMAMFQPMSPFNILATMCGYNTVLTKYQNGIFDFLVNRRIRSFASAVKNTGNFIGGRLNDYIQTRRLSVGERYSVR